MSTGNSYKRVRRRLAARTNRARAAILVLLLAMTGSGWDTQALAQESNEYQVKAAFLFKFVHYVDWPAGAFASGDAPIIVGLVGESLSATAIEQTINGKSTSGRQLQIKRFPTTTAITRCHILFVSSSQRSNLPQILAAAGPAALTVGETGTFSEMGGIITFVLVDNKVRFEINQTVAKKGGLKISAQLLSLARRVK